MNIRNRNFSQKYCWKGKMFAKCSHEQLVSFRIDCIISAYTKRALDLSGSTIVVFVVVVLIKT